MRRYVKRWVAGPILLLSFVPAMSFDDAAFCERITEFATKANADKPSMADPLTRNEAMAVDCDRKTVKFKKSIALSFSELGETWLAIKQREWNSVYCGDQAWAPIFASGWKVSLTLVTFDGKHMTVFAECY